MKQLSKILFVAEAEMDNTWAFNYATALASHHQADLALLSVVEEAHGQWASQVQQAQVQQQQAQLDALCAVKPADLGHCSTRIRSGKAFIEIIREVQDVGYDLIVKTPEQPVRLRFSGTDMKLLRKCPCPLLLAHPQDGDNTREILLALDYEPDNPENEPLNRELIDMATSLAISEFAQLHVVHAWQFEHESFLRSARSGLSTAEVDKLVELEAQQRHAWLSQFVEQHCAGLGTEVRDYLNPTLHVIKGDAKQVVADFANDAGVALIVMGTLGRTGIQGFVIGNTSEQILNQIHCAVLAIKPAGFVSPIT